MIAFKFLPLTFSLLAFLVSAGELPKTDLDLEPCINGAVSASGTYPSQAMEDQIQAYLAWSTETGRPFYLFQVAGYVPENPHPQP
jgi:hypothetical protein